MKSNILKYSFFVVAIVLITNVGIGHCEDNPTSDPNLAVVPYVNPNLDLVPYVDPNTPTNPTPNTVSSTPNLVPTQSSVPTPNTVPTPNSVPTPSPEPTENFRKTKRPFGAFLESMEAYFHERNNGKTPYQAYQTKYDTYLKARGYRN